MIITEETYLEHYGVKGMRWGQRKAARKEAGIGGRNPAIRRSGLQKVGIVAAGYASYAVGSSFVAKQLMRRIPNKTEDDAAQMLGKMAIAGLAGIGAGVGATVVGVKYTRRLMDKHNQMKVGDIDLPPEFD